MVRADVSATRAGSDSPSQKSASSFTFWLYMYFLVDFFLHLAARMPGYGLIRPTLLLVAIISISLFVQRDRFTGWTKEPIVHSLLILLGYIVFTVPLVEWPGSVVKNNLPDFVKAIVFFFFTVLIVDTDKRLRILLVVFVGCQVFRVIEPVFLHLTEGYWGSRTHLGHGEFSQRLSGAPSDVVNPNGLGFVIVTAIPFLHYLLWTGGVKLKVLYLLTMPILLYGLILTQSRGAFLALLVVGFFIFRESKKKWLLVLAALLVAFAGWQVMTDEQKDRYLSLVGASETSNAATASGRFQGMLTEFSIGLERPIVGHGLGTTPEAKTHTIGGRQASHNLYAELLIELGIVGMLLFLAFLLNVYRALKRSSEFQSEFWGNDTGFYGNLNRSFLAIFWMYSVYSINYWGLSQYYWYFFAGSVVAFYHINLSRMQPQGETEGIRSDQSSDNKFSNIVSVGGRRMTRKAV